MFSNKAWWAFLLAWALFIFETCNKMEFAFSPAAAIGVWSDPVIVAHWCVIFKCRPVTQTVKAKRSEALPC